MPRLITLGTVLVLGLCPPAGVAQGLLFGDQTHCAVTAGGGIAESDITVICGIPPDQMVAMMQLVASPDPADRDEAIRRIEALLPENASLQAGAAASFLAILGEKSVPPERLLDRLAEIATRYLQLQEQIESFRVADPEVQLLRDRAAAALAAPTPDLDAARRDLEAARAMVRTNCEAVARVLADQQREEAALVREQALLEASRLNRLAAAELYLEAAVLLPESDEAERWSDTLAAGDLLLDYGDDRGDNAALVRAISVYGHALKLRARPTAPADWAATQNKIGNALATLGERESNSARLEEALVAYRAALEERTRERVPLEWAGTQNNLGNALRSLGDRQTGTARLEEAIVAYLAALEERTRERVPFD